MSVDIIKNLAAGVLTDSAATIYEAPEGKTVIVREIALCNTSASYVHVTFTVDGTHILCERALDANESYFVKLNLVMPAESILAGEAETTAVIDYYISGIEVA